MFKVNNKKAINNLANKSFRASKLRNIIAIAAISLTSILFTVLFTVGSGMIENFQRQTMRQAGGDGMGVLKYITDDQYNNIKNHKLIDEISYNRILCNSVDNEDLIKRRGELYYMDDTAMNLSFCEPTTGHKPILENEIIMDTKTIKLLGAKQEIGSPVTLEISVHGKKVKRDFIISGWWEADPVFNVSLMITSRAYVDKYIDELYNSYKEDYDLTGAINSYIMFSNSLNLETKLDKVITESGYSTNETDSNFIANNVNWSYISSNFSFDFSTVISIIMALALIIFTGYLIIYNIFQISVIKDIRFYGLLKTIGTTGKQIKRIIHNQAFILSCIGIPIGLFIGYFIGCAIVPLIMNQTIYANSQFKTSANPLIFIGSTVFAFITVAISTGKPGKIASKVSPVEAIKYTDKNEGRKRSYNRKYRSRVSNMALSNIGRNKLKTILVVISMALSLILFNTIYTFSLGFDMNKFLSKFVDTDYLIAHADYFNYQFGGPENSISESMIKAVQQQPGFEEGGRIFANLRDKEFFSVEDKNFKEEYNRSNDGNPICAVYGLEDLPLNRLEVLEGKLDFEKLKTGNYILEGIQLNDDNSPVWEASHFEIGDKVILHNYKGTAETRLDNEYTTREFTVMAKVAVKTTNSCGNVYNYSYYLPSNIYKEMISVPGIMSYVYNVSDEEERSMDLFLQGYTDNIEPYMNFSSKNTRVKEFEGLRNTVLGVGGILSFIIGLIGILNFVNSMITSIITRRQEFAMLQSIGMTNKQLRKMLILEGLYYTALAGIISILLSILFSKVIVNTIASNLWFFSYKFTILPLIITIPILLVIGIILPATFLNVVTKQSVVERLREIEA